MKNFEKDKFFSIIAHDLRSPLHGLLGLTEMMANGTEVFTEKEMFEQSKHLYSSVSNLNKLIENLFEWAQIQRGVMSFNPKEFALESVVQRSIDALYQSAAQKSIAIKNEIEEGVNIIADEKMIETVLRNLLSNAVKFTKRGGLVVIKTKNQDNKSIEISVSDNGVGIPDSKLKRLFKVEEKVGSKGTEGELSTGLGLLLCKEFVVKNGGKIWVESELARGSIFTFSLPAITKDHSSSENV